MRDPEATSPHAGASCAEGRCAMGPCDEGWHDADGDAGSGCEYLCAPTRGGVEACDAIDNDCDGIADEGVDGVEACDGADLHHMVTAVHLPGERAWRYERGCSAGSSA